VIGVHALFFFIPRRVFPNAYIYMYIDVL